VHEDVHGKLAVLGHQCPLRLKGHHLAVGAERRPAAAGVGLLLVAVHTHPLGGGGLAVADEHVAGEVGVPGDQVVGVGGEGHKAAVGAERRPGASRVGLGPAAGQADPLGGPGDPVTHKDVHGLVLVALDQVGGRGREGHQAAVGADRRPAEVGVDGAAPAGRLPLAAVHADPLGGGGLPVADEHVGGAVGVPRDQVGRKRPERDEAAAGADGGQH